MSMELQYLCTNCLAGSIKNGTCDSCHYDTRRPARRPAGVLPDRYMLTSQYYIGRVVGNGGFGITYLAWDCKEQRKVIVKELFPRKDVRRVPETQTVVPVEGQEEYFEKTKQRFREEALVLAEFLQEPSVLDVYGLMEENNTVYYAMEYLSGLDLRSYMKQNGRLAWPHVSGYVRQILQVLHILHGRGLIHRDISPDNIYLTSLTEAKLIDFGSVRCFNNGQGLTTILKQVYAPIEQYFTNGNQGPWTDIYSLSVTIYQALSEIQPASAPDRMKKDKVLSIEGYCPELPDHVARAIMKGMSLREVDRFPDVVAMAAALFPGESLFRRTGTPRAGGQQTSSASPVLRCISGQYQGRKFQLAPGSGMTFGRDSQCEMHYPPDAPGISRRHCSLWCDQSGQLFIRDEHSTYGTSVSGYAIEPEKWYTLARGSTIRFGNERFHVD